MADFKEKLKAVKIVFMDVDGVLNDGTVYFTGDTSPKTWFVRDRLGIKILTSCKQDIKVIWISGRPSDELRVRADELGVAEVFANISDKIEVMDDVLSKYNLSYADAMYIGDDLIDLGCMSRVGVSCCPADAVGEVKAQADFVSAYPGGRGAVREIIEEILRSQGIWEQIVADFKKAI
jgi:3-deoxy-D-manno-octulosonate 8-phosphate phosphatase (KDO 8-P phosphatase)